MANEKEKMREVVSMTMHKSLHREAKALAYRMGTKFSFLVEESLKKYISELRKTTADSQLSIEF